MDEDEAPVISDNEVKDELGGWTEFKEFGSDEGPVNEDEEEFVPDETIHEAAVGKGLLGALKLLKELLSGMVETWIRKKASSYALCFAQYLEFLQFVRCRDVSDEGLQHVIHFPSLRTLRLIKCLGVTNDGLKPLMGELLVVEDRPQISERGLQGAAESVSFRQDLSWMY